MTTESKQFIDALLDLAWAQWTELGIPGLKRMQAHAAIWPEELICLTAVLAKHDPRLAQEAAGWCVKYDDLISVSRLKNLTATLSPEQQVMFAAFAKTVNGAGNLKWPVLGTKNASAYSWKPSSKASLRDLQTSSMLVLRLRCLFGVGARADIIASRFRDLAHPIPIIASSLTEVGYSKRNIAEVLEKLTMGGLLTARLVQNQLQYQLSNSNKLIGMTGDKPTYSPRWYRVIPLLLKILQFLHDTENKPKNIRGIAVINFVEKTMNTFPQTFNIEQWRENLPEAWDQFTMWICEETRKLIHSPYRLGG